MTAPEILGRLESCRFNFTCEAELQEGIANLLPEFLREYRLSDQDRIDFFGAGVGIEVKVSGSNSDIIRQLHRYAQSLEITALILFTTKSRHLRGLPSAINGKAVFGHIQRSMC